MAHIDNNINLHYDLCYLSMNILFDNFDVVLCSTYLHLSLSPAQYDSSLFESAYHDQLTDSTEPLLVSA